MKMTAQFRALVADTLEEMNLPRTSDNIVALLGLVRDVLLVVDRKMSEIARKEKGNATD